MPDGSAVWKACVSEKGQIAREIQALARNSGNVFFAIDMESGKSLTLNAAPSKLKVIQTKKVPQGAVPRRAESAKMTRNAC
jgi:hypothetical protein